MKTQAHTCTQTSEGERGVANLSRKPICTCADSSSSRALTELKSPASNIRRTTSSSMRVDYYRDIKSRFKNPRRTFSTPTLGCFMCRENTFYIERTHSITLYAELTTLVSERGRPVWKK
jgi:hypothetical protein